MARAYGGRSAEQRRADRRAALLDAALDLLDREGVEAVTMRRVSLEARLNDRYFYEHFADRDALLVALMDEMTSAGTARILDAIAPLGDDLEQFVRVGMQACVAYLAEDPRRGRLLVVSQATEALRSRRHELVRVLADTMVAQRVRVLPEPAADSDADLTAIALVSGILELLTMWIRGDLDLDGDRLAGFLARLILTNVEVVQPSGSNRAGPRHRRDGSVR